MTLEMRCPSMGRWTALFGRTIVIAALLSSTGFAAAHYVRAGATGSGNGSDWTNACPDFTGSCAVASLVRGDTYYVADGNYATRKFNTATSGTSVISIKKATIPDHGTATGWSDSYGDGQAVFANQIYLSSDYWVFDGQTRTNLTSGYGFVIDNHSSPSDNNAVLIGDPYSGGGGTPANYVTMKYFEVRGSGDRSNPKIYSDRGLQAYVGSAKTETNLYMGYFYIHDTGGECLLAMNTIGMVIEQGQFARNHDTPTGHSTGIGIRNNNNITVRHNWFVDIEGTAHITTEGAFDASMSNYYIYGNVFLRTPGNPSAMNSVSAGPVYMMQVVIAGNVFIYNNTVVNMNYGPDNGGPGRFLLERTGNSLGNVRVQNNLWYNSQNTYSTCTSCLTFAWTNNSYFDSENATDTDSNKEIGTGSPFNNLAAGDFHLKKATAAGVRLNAPFDVDASGVTRGADGLWDRGAFEFGSRTGVLAPPAQAPTVIIR